MKMGRTIALSLTLVWSAASERAGAQPTTTVIAHGFTTGSKGVWVEAMADAILARGGGGTVYRYTGPSGVLTPVTTPHSTISITNIVVIFNWVPESASPSPGPNWEYTQAAGDALTAVLRAPAYAGGTSGPASLVTGRALHFLGHSRGACVISEAALRLGIAGIPVDQVTFMDPHPVNGTLDAPLNPDWGDPIPAKWSNVTWADNYWRADGGGFPNGFDFDGITITNAFNTQLSEAALECCGYSGAHSDVHLWYHGTIDTADDACDGEQCITPTMRTTWWQEPPAGYTQRGFYYSALGGGSGTRPAQPAGAALPQSPVIVNGDFDRGSYAGWSYHGGAVSGQIVSDASNGYLRLGAGTGASGSHNRFVLPVGAQSVMIDLRVFTASGRDELAVSLIDQDGGVYVLGGAALAVVGGWKADVSFTIPSGVPRAAVYTLRFSVPASTAAVIGIDNVDIAVQPPSAADVNGDGCVDVNDLLIVIGAWGGCPVPPAQCAADINGDGVVDVNDLLSLIGAWGCG